MRSPCDDCDCTRPCADWLAELEAEFCLDAIEEWPDSIPLAEIEAILWSNRP